MPTVQRYGAPKIETARLPGARRTAAETDLSTGAGLAAAEAAAARRVGAGEVVKAEALGRLGGTVSEVGGQWLSAEARVQAQARREAQQRANETAAYEWNNRLDRWTADALYGADGALTKKGKDAQDGPRAVMEAFDEAASAVGQDLTNDDQRVAYAKDKAGREARLYGTLLQHAAQEQATYERTELQAFRDNRVTAAVAQSANKAMVGEHIEAGVHALRTTLPKQGAGPEAVEEQVRQFRSAALEGVIQQRLTEGDPALAQDYFDSVEGTDTFDVAARARLTKALKVGDVRQQAQAATAKILSEGGTRAEQRAKAKDLPNSEVADEALRRIEHEHAVQEVEQREKAADDVDRAYTLADQGRPIPPDLESRLGTHLSGLRAFERQRVQGQEPEDDLPTYYRLMTMSVDDPEKFKQELLPTYSSKLSKEAIKELTRNQVAIKRGDKAGVDQALAGFRTHSQIFEDTLTQYGINPKPIEGSDAETALAQLRRALDQRVEDQQAITGKKLSPTDIQLQLDQLLSASKTTPGSWGLFFSGKGPAHTYTQRYVDMTIDDVPFLEKQKIERALKARGRPATPAAILDRYILEQTAPPLSPP